MSEILSVLNTASGQFVFLTHHDEAESVFIKSLVSERRSLQRKRKTKIYISLKQEV